MRSRGNGSRSLLLSCWEQDGEESLRCGHIEENTNQQWAEGLGSADLKTQKEGVHLKAWVVVRGTAFLGIAKNILYRDMQEPRGQAQTLTAFFQLFWAYHVPQLEQENLRLTVN